MENGFHFHKVLKSGQINCEEQDSWQTFILNENHRHLPKASDLSWTINI